MTRVFDEKFEGTGFEETWSSGKTVGSGSTLDEDADTDDVSNPSSWIAQCLKMDAVSPNFDCFVEDSPSYTLAMHFRIEFVITAESLSDGNQFVFFRTWNDNYILEAFTCYIRQVSGNLRMRFTVNDDGTNTTLDDTTVIISLNQRYRLEVQYDITNNTYEFRLDDAVLFSGSLTSTHPTDISRFRAGGSAGPAITMYFDLIAVDDAEFIGSDDTFISDYRFRQRYYG